MRFHAPPLEDSGLGITPLVDVVLLLLIFFIVTTSFSEPRIALELPDAVTGAPEDPRERLRVTLRSDGGLLVDGSASDAEGLTAALAAGGVDGLELRADREVPHGRVVEVLDLSREHGVADVSIAVDARE